ncbi:MAG: HAMP domain-containing histidine kinase [Bacteroidaceae bacterium]|nr:HAMP domain-containing histidine kinase [Bacteroidaceae bacterium]
MRTLLILNSASVILFPDYTVLSKDIMIILSPGIITLLVSSLSLIITLCLVHKYQRKAEIERMKAAKTMENNENKISYLANIVHELRTPLILIYNPIKELLKKKNINNKDFEQIKGIYNQVNRMTSLINLILDSSRNKITKEDLVPETTELNTWINDKINDYDTLCYNGDHHIVFRPDPRISSAEIDRNIIETGLSNLINNAIKYSPKGTTITVFTKREGEQVSITVKDQGRGFHCDSEELFRKNFREKPDDSVPGYGLGLTYVRFLMELAEGTITASHNDDGIGSSFSITFPIRFRK